MLPVPASCAPPRSARNSRRRENHMTIMLARIPSNSCSTMTVTKEAMPRPSSERNTARSMMLPMTRDRKITKVLTTPCTSVRVTMSPLATCVISWPSTASTSWRFMRCSSPLLTATRAALRLAPVAKAFGSGESKIPTSGMPTPTARAWCSTTESSHCSVASPGGSMTRTPMVIFAIHFDMASEMKEPEKPKNAANTSRPPRLLPCTASQASRPSRRATTDSTRTTARLVARNSTMRFMAGMEPWVKVRD